MKKKTVLVIEDDRAIRQGIVDALDYEGYQILEAGDGPRGLEMAISADRDLVLLDLVLPGGDGLDILEEIRKTQPILPVIILTARGDEDDRVRGLKLGADDYVVKPFSIKELLARVEAVLRRSAERPIDIGIVPIPGGQADLERSEIRFTDGRRAELSERERELIRYLAANSGRVVSRDEILARVWRIDPDAVETRTVDMHVARLRDKLGADGVIETVRGKGYRFNETDPC